MHNVSSGKGMRLTIDALSMMTPVLLDVASRKSVQGAMPAK
jgi:hypothetical protein